MVAGFSGWLSNAGGVSYPPAPWHLEGNLHVSMWRLRPEELPAACLPSSVRPVTVFGRVVVGTAWAVYQPSGVLAYNEVLAAVRVRVGARRYTTVTHIWVDHPSSIAGGRDLWGMPKDLATFRVSSGGAAGRADFAASAATTDGRPIATLRFQSRMALPGRWRLRTRTAQQPLGHGSGTGLKIAEAEALTTVEFGAATWNFAADGPLGFLSGREASVSARLVGTSLRFGG